MNAADFCGNTILHIIAMGSVSEAQFEFAKTFVNTFGEEARLIRNKDGDTALDMLRGYQKKGAILRSNKSY